MSMTRLPAFPLITNDPYLSIWSAADRPTDAETTHWAGDRKPLRGRAVIDGKPLSLPITTLLFAGVRHCGG